ncbi:iron uptake transporter deferrochelatase/peroxidase subunit [Streptantibioticus parmotrematis]|uniref:iron uptake transporter deferrochelatase/peroxidase subunit n=1 Tax=Streptantibioticus parmotrematis TaxID=2873249 RepID=UPI0033D494FC
MSSKSVPSRRNLLGAALGAAAAGAAGYAVAHETGHAGGSPAAARTQEPIPFYGARQAGIATPAQDRLAFAAFDITATDAESVQVMLGTWAAAAAQMTRGLPVGADDRNTQSPPVDTGEAEGLGPARLTVTVGFGPTFFDERFGLSHHRPAALADLPTLPGDGSLQPARSGGDLCVQACADDPTVAFHVIRNFARLARGTAVIRWSQLGFGRTSSTSQAQQTERNLMGFKDGTRNIKSESATDMADYVWVGKETDQSWMRDGSYLVARRIRMLIESWDTDSLADQQNVFGRFRTSGAPLTGHGEFDTPDLNAKGHDGQPVISAGAHIRLASPSSNNGQKILRRGYSYTDGIDATTGLLDAGLFFLAYQKDPRKQFVPIQTRLGRQDNLNEYIRHTGSALFAVPPGLKGAGDWWGKSLFA